MMILAAVALFAAAPSASPPASAEDEMFCVMDGMSDADLSAAAGTVLGSLEQASKMASVYGDSAEETCAGRYKWTDGQRNAASLIAATHVALGLMDERLHGRYDDRKIDILLDGLSQADRDSLGFNPPPSSEADHAAAYKRFDAAATRAGIAKADYPLIGEYLSLAARAAQARALWTRLLAQKK